MPLLKWWTEWWTELRSMFQGLGLTYVSPFIQALESW